MMRSALGALATRVFHTKCAACLTPTVASARAMYSAASTSCCWPTGICLGPGEGLGVGVRGGVRIGARARVRVRVRGRAVGVGLGHRGERRVLGVVLALGRVGQGHRLLVGEAEHEVAEQLGGRLPDAVVLVAEAALQLGQQQPRGDLAEGGDRVRAGVGAGVGARVRARVRARVTSRKAAIKACAARIEASRTWLGLGLGLG